MDPADKRRRLSDAQVLTTALVAARYFGGNLVLGQRYMEQHWGENRLDKSGFTRQLHRLADTLAGLFATVGALLKTLHTEPRYVIDSFPVAVCHNTRIPRCKLLTGKAYHGRCASKRSWFYGFKVQVVATTDGVPVDYYIHAGSEADQTGRRWPRTCPKAASSTPTPATPTTSRRTSSKRPRATASQRPARKTANDRANRTKPF